MNDQFNNDEEVLARLVHEAGDPRVTPDSQYAKRLKETILERTGEAGGRANTEKDDTRINETTAERIFRMNKIIKFATAASILVAIGILGCWIVIGGSTNIAFAEVAKALDNIRTATYECTMEMKNPMDVKGNRITMKAFFLAPSSERVEMSMSIGSDKSVMILDHQAMKGLTLAPEQKLATTIDLSKIKKTEGPSNLFAMVRQLVREGDSNPDKKVKPLGKKEIEGRELVGFLARSNMADQTFWADPQTARLVRVDIDLPNGAGHGVMNSFQYDVDLDPSLFSLEPPAGYTLNKINAKMPTEEDFVNILRLVAEHNDGTFPATLGMNGKEFQKTIQEVAKTETEKLMKDPEILKLRDKLKAQYGNDMNGFMKAWMKEMMPFNQKLTQKYMQGMMFYNTLTPANDSHYIGSGVKLGAPDRPIFWYKPTGSDKYHVIYADLSVKDMTSDEIEKLPGAVSK